MKKQWKISVPKPCHEDWSKMTLEKQGRFCELCSKVVIDFTKKSKEEIQQYLHNNHGKSLCGHFRREQLDAITIEIPQRTFEQSLPFQKCFLLALLFVMGTTLFSCQNSEGEKQKIEEVILIDFQEKNKKTDDTVPHKTCTTNNTDTDSLAVGEPLKETTITTTGITTTGDVDPFRERQSREFSLDSIIEIEEEDEITEDETDIIIGFIVEKPPRFPKATSPLGYGVMHDFNEQMQSFFKTHFNTPQGILGLERKKFRIIAQFQIDTTGEVTDIKVTAPHPAIQKEVERVFKKLPVFIAGEIRGKKIKTRYTIPIKLHID